ncbi:MAG: hypothetical protein ACLP9C_02755 [Acidimicrobiales bacterium]
MRRVALRPIDQMTADWVFTARSGPSRHALARLAVAEPEVAALGVADLGELVEALRVSGPAGDRERAARVLRAMLRSQSVHPLVPRAILQALLPGLVSVARRLSWGAGGEWDDGGAFFADLVATAWEVIIAWSGDDRSYAVLDLLSAIRCRLRRQAARHRSTGERESTGLDPETGPAAGSSGTTDLEDLARTIDLLTGRGLDPGDAAVLYGNCVLGLTTTELARMTGRSRRHLDVRRRRAAQELCA